MEEQERVLPLPNPLCATEGSCALPVSRSTEQGGREQGGREQRSIKLAQAGQHETRVEAHQWATGEIQQETICDFSQLERRRHTRKRPRTHLRCPHKRKLVGSRAPKAVSCDA